MTPAEFAAARASIEAQRDDMARENERRRGWMRASPYDRDGNLTIRSILTGELTTIRLGKIASAMKSSRRSSKP